MRPSSQVLSWGEWATSWPGKKNGTALLPLFRGGLTGKIGCLGSFFLAFETSIPYNQYTNFIYDPQFVERGGEHGIVTFTSSIVTEQRYSWIFVTQWSDKRLMGGGRDGARRAMFWFWFGFALTSLSFDSIDQKGWSYRGSRNHTKTPVQKKNPRGNSVNHAAAPPCPFFFHRLP